MNKSGHGVIQSEETLLLLVCSTMLLENEKSFKIWHNNFSSKESNVKGNYRCAPSSKLGTVWYPIDKQCHYFSKESPY